MYKYKYISSSICPLLDIGEKSHNAAPFILFCMFLNYERYRSAAFISWWCHVLFLRQVSDFSKFTKIISRLRKHHPSASRYHSILVLHLMNNKDRMIFGGTRVMFPNVTLAEVPDCRCSQQRHMKERCWG